MSGTETHSSSPITSASLKQSNSLLNGDVGQEVIAMMNTSGLYLENNMLHDKTGVIADLGKDSIYYPGNKAIFLKVDTIDSKEHLVIGGQDNDGFRYCTVVDSLGSRHTGERKSASREEMESHGFPFPNSSAIAVAAIPEALLESLDAPVVPGVEDLEKQVAKAKELGSRVSEVNQDLTELKKVHYELSVMFSEFLEVPGNTVHAECNNNGIGQEIVDISYDEIGGLSLIGRSSKGLFGSWSKFSFDNFGSKRLNLKEGWTGIKDSFPDQVTG